MFGETGKSQTQEKVTEVNADKDGVQGTKVGKASACSENSDCDIRMCRRLTLRMHRWNVSCTNNSGQD